MSLDTIFTLEIVLVVVLLAAAAGGWAISSLGAYVAVKASPTFSSLGRNM